jgi:glycolate oxidase FAD binding subunit
VQTVYTPASEPEVEQLVTEAARTRTAIEVLGNGSKRGIGRPMDTMAAISTSALSGVTLYEPAEMILAAKTGTLLQDIETLLADNRQALAFEPTDLGPLSGGAPGAQTIGAVFATNASGARRISAGAARDHLTGVRAVIGNGQTIKSGGRVMKNVTGVDVTRGLANSWGTLGIMTEVTFKVIPAHAETSTLVLLGLPDAIAVEALCLGMGTPFEVSGAVHLQAGLAARLAHDALREQGRSVTLLRLEHAPSSVAYRKGRLAETLKAYGDIHELDHAGSQLVWSELRRLSVFQASAAPVWRLSTAPKTGPKVVDAIRRYMDCKAYYDWSGGLIYIEVLPTSDAGAADVRRVIATHGGHATLLRAERETRQIVETFQPLDPALDALSRRIKEAFDPLGIFNPGRLFPTS